MLSQKKLVKPVSKLSKLSYYRRWSFHPIFRSIDFVRSKKVSSINWYQRWKAATGQGVAATRQAGKKKQHFLFGGVDVQSQYGGWWWRGRRCHQPFFACIENHSINASLWDWLSEGRGEEYHPSLPPSQAKKKQVVIVDRNFIYFAFTTFGN